MQLSSLTVSFDTFVKDQNFTAQAVDPNTQKTRQNERLIVRRGPTFNGLLWALVTIGIILLGIAAVTVVLRWRWKRMKQIA